MNDKCDDIKAIDLINFGLLSKLLTGRTDVIRANRIGKKHKKEVASLIKVINNWKKRHKV